MKRFLKENVKQIILSIIVVLLVGCASYNKLSSGSRPYYNDAKDLWKEGKQIDAIYVATKGVLIDDAYTNTKEFLYENYNNTMNAINEELKKTENTQDTGFAVRRLHIYNTLVGINSNVSKMKLPLKHHKNKWQWTTETKDYSKQAEEAFNQAYIVFYNFGKKRLLESKNGNDIANANLIFANGHNRFTVPNSDFRKQSHTNISKEFCDYADLHKDAATWQEAILAGYAFYYAKLFKTDTTRAYEGYVYASKRISTLLTEEGKVYTKKGDLQSLLDADGMYTNAISWNKENKEAINLKEELKSKIAESYYNKALAMDNVNNNDFLTTKAMYENALKYVPNYKDCQARIYTLSIRYELITLRLNVEKTQSEYDSIHKRFLIVSDGVDYASETMDKITYISDNVRKLNKITKTTEQVLVPLTAIPVINVVATPLKTSIVSLRVPIEKVEQYFDKSEEPLITPLKNGVSKVKTVVDKIKLQMDITSSLLVNTKKTASALETCIHKVKNEEDLKQSELVIKELSKDLIKITEQLSKFNDMCNSLINTSNQIASVMSSIHPVLQGIDAIKPAMDQIGKVTGKIDKVLDKKFLGISARDALSAGGKAFDLAMKAIEPILNELKIKIPEIPGTEVMMAEIDKFKEKFDVVTEEYNKVKEKCDQYTDIQGFAVKNLNVLVAKTGCGCGVSVSVK